MSVSVYANPVVRGMAGFYTTTFLSAAWSMIIPTIPVLAQYFSITAGGAAQIVTVFAIGKFIGTIIGGSGHRPHGNANHPCGRLFSIPACRSLFTPRS